MEPSCPICATSERSHGVRTGCPECGHVSNKLKPLYRPIPIAIGERMAILIFLLATLLGATVLYNAIALRIFGG